MSNNAELIKAIKDAENAIAKAINTLQVASENHQFTKTEQRRMDLIEEAVDRVLSRRDEEKQREEANERWLQRMFKIQNEQIGSRNRGWFK